MPDAAPSLPRRRLFPLSHAGSLAFPPFFWLITFFILPMFIILAASFAHKGTFGGIVWEFTLSNYSDLLDPLYLKAILRSLSYALLATSIPLLISYPAAYTIAFAPPRRKQLLMFLIILPFWSNFLIRIFSWLILLTMSVSGCTSPFATSSSSCLYAQHRRTRESAMFLVT